MLRITALLFLATLSASASEPETWRSEHRIIDLHMHIDATEERVARAVRIMDGAEIGRAHV